MPLSHPAILAFEGRVYRLDRISATKPGDVEVVRLKKPYTSPVLRELGSVRAMSLASERASFASLATASPSSELPCPVPVQPPGRSR